jgi:Tfp pilus assembly protein PilP
MRSVNTLVVAILLAVSSSSLLAQANSAGAAAVAPPAAKATPHAAKTTAKPKAKSAAKKPVEGTASPAEVQASGEGDKLARRDPFESLVNRNKDTGAKNLPPGKAGLQVSTLRLDGIVRSSNGMIAVVSNPQARTYFLREGDQLYDGRVEKIAMDGVSFHELGKDAFGKPVERQVNKRIYASAGEQQ